MKQYIYTSLNIIFITGMLFITWGPKQVSAQNKDTQATDSKTTDTIKKQLKPLNSPGKKVLAAQKTTTATTKTVTVKSTTPDKKKDTGKAETKSAKKTDKEKALEHDQKAADRIEKVLDFGIQDERLEAINKIKDIKDKGIREKLLVKLESVISEEIDSQLIVRAIIVASQLNAQNTAPAILGQIDNDSDDVQVAAVHALKKLKVTSSRDALVVLLKKQDLSKNSSVTEALLDTLGEFKAAELSPFIQKSLEDHKTTNSVRQYMVLFLGHVQDAKTDTYLKNLYNDEDETIILRAYAINSLARRRSNAATQDIKVMLKKFDAYPFKKKQKYYTLYIYSVAALARLGDKDALPRLQNSLKSNNVSVRLSAIKLIKELKDIKDKRTIDILKYKMEYDPNKTVRKEAKEALKAMGVEVDKDKKTDKDNTNKK